MSQRTSNSASQQVKPPVDAVRKVVEYLYHGEERHYEDCKAMGDPARGHIFQHVRKLDRWLSRQNRIANDASGDAAAKLFKLQYMPAIPLKVPKGKVVVHNHIRPARRQGTRGFRFYLAEATDQHLEVCPCKWAPELGVHYRFKAAWARAELRQRPGRRNPAGL